MTEGSENLKERNMDKSAYVTESKMNECEEMLDRTYSENKSKKKNKKNKHPKDYSVFSDNFESNSTGESNPENTNLKVGSDSKLDSIDMDISADVTQSEIIEREKVIDMADSENKPKKKKKNKHPKDYRVFSENLQLHATSERNPENVNLKDGSKLDSMDMNKSADVTQSKMNESEIVLDTTDSENKPKKKKKKNKHFCSVFSDNPESDSTSESNSQNVNLKEGDEESSSIVENNNIQNLCKSKDNDNNEVLEENQVKKQHTILEELSDPVEIRKKINTLKRQTEFSELNYTHCENSDKEISPKKKKRKHNQLANNESNISLDWSINITLNMDESGDGCLHESENKDNTNNVMQLTEIKKEYISEESLDSSNSSKKKKKKHNRQMEYSHAENTCLENSDFQNNTNGISSQSEPVNEKSKILDKLGETADDSTLFKNSNIKEVVTSDSDIPRKKKKKKNKHSEDNDVSAIFEAEEFNKNKRLKEKDSTNLSKKKKKKCKSQIEESETVNENKQGETVDESILFENSNINKVISDSDKPRKKKKKKNKHSEDSDVSGIFEIDEFNKNGELKKKGNNVDIRNLLVALINNSLEKFRRINNVDKKDKNKSHSPENMNNDNEMIVEINIKEEHSTERFSGEQHTTYENVQKKNKTKSHSHENMNDYNGMEKEVNIKKELSTEELSDSTSFSNKKRKKRKRQIEDDSICTDLDNTLNSEQNESNSENSSEIEIPRKKKKKRSHSSNEIHKSSVSDEQFSYSIKSEELIIDDDHYDSSVPHLELSDSHIEGSNENSFMSSHDITKSKKKRKRKTSNEKEENILSENNILIVKQEESKDNDSSSSFCDIEKPKKKRKSEENSMNLKKNSLSGKELFSNADTGLDRSDLFEITAEEAEEVKKLKILVPFEVPEIHMLQTRSSRPTKDQKEKIESLGIKIKTGFYTIEEDEKIKQNWLEFCKVHDLDTHPGPFLQFSHPYMRNMKNSEKHKFLQFLAHGLDNRLLSSVYSRFKRLFLSTVVKSGRFSAEEDETIMNYIKSNPDTTTFYKDLAKLLNRDKTAIEKRFLHLKNNPKTYYVYWSKENMKILINNMVKVTHSDSYEDLKDRKITPKEWKKISKKMDNISVRKLQRAWNITIHPKVFSKNAVDSLVVKKKIIKKLYKEKVTDWKSINWKTLAEKFEGFTADKLYTLIKHTVYAHVPEDLRDDLKESLKHLYEVFVDSGNKIPRSKICNHINLEM